MRRGIQNIDMSGDNRTILLKATNVEVYTNKNMQDALQKIQDAQAERSQTIELHIIALVYTNQFT